jgi:hypothetical protein
MSRLTYRYETLQRECNPIARIVSRTASRFCPGVSGISRQRIQHPSAWLVSFP